MADQGFHDVVPNALFLNAFKGYGIGETADQDDRHVGPYFKDLLGQFDAVKLGHGLIGDDQVEVFGTAPKQLQGFTAVGLRGHRIPHPLQHLLRQQADFHFVIDEQDALGSGGHRFVGLVLLGDLGGGLGQIDIEGGSLADLAVDENLAVMAGDDPMHRGQAHAGAFADRPGGEEGFENPPQGFVVHADSGIPKAHLDVPPPVNVGPVPGEFGIHLEGFQDHFQEAAGIFHGPKGIGAKVHDHLVQLRWIGHDRRAFGVDFEPHFDVRRCGRLDQLERVFDDQVRQQRKHLEFAAAAESHDLVDQLLGAVGAFDHPLDIGVGLAVLRHLVKRHVAVADNRRQDVVEIMGDAAGQGSDGFKPFRLPELALEVFALPHGLLAFGDILAGTQGPGDFILLVLDQRHMPLDQAALTGFRQHLAFPPLDEIRLAGHQPFKIHGGLFPGVLGNHRFDPISSQQFNKVVAEDLAALAVDEGDRAFGIHRHDHGSGNGEVIFRPLFFVQHPLFGLFAFGDIHDGVLNGVLAFPFHRPGDVQQGDDGAVAAYGIVFILGRRPAAPLAGIPEHRQAIQFVRRERLGHGIQRHQFLHRFVTEDGRERPVGKQQLPILMNENPLDRTAKQAAVTLLELKEGILRLLAPGVGGLGPGELAVNGLQLFEQFLPGLALALLADLFLFGHQTFPATGNRSVASFSPGP